MARRWTLYLPVMIAAALAMACLVALLAVSQKSEAAFPGKNGRIAFDGFRDTGGTGGSSSEIITVSPDGTGMKQLTSASGASNPTFSPNGEKIAYAANSGADPRSIYVMNSTGDAKKALTDNNNLPEYGPAWSPDGKKIAFIRQERVSTEGQSNWQVDVWVMNADGSEQKKLTDDFNDEGAPTWSPDGTKIAFVDGPDIWTVKPEGSGRHNLTNTPNSYEEDPDFSPDGKKLAFASKGKYKKPDIYTMQLDGGELTNVTDSRYVGEEDCVWSPSGTKIAYRKDLSENPEIFTKNADGSGRSKNVSNDPQNNSSPDWGPKPTTATG